MTGAFAAVGNAAKVYLFRLLEGRIEEGRPFSILDLGCGDARDVAPLVRRHAHVRYVGVDPSASACAGARRALEGCDAEIVHARAYDLRLAPADAVLSFGVLQHVADRPRYLRCARAHLAEGAVLLLTLDTGHVAGVSAPRRAARGAAAVAARLGWDSRYWTWVRDAELRALLLDAGLAIRDEKVFNTGLKDVYPLVPEERRREFVRRWLDLELELNAYGIRYRDELARVFRTRCLVLAPVE